MYFAKQKPFDEVSCPWNVCLLCAWSSSPATYNSGTDCTSIRTLVGPTAGLYEIHKTKSCPSLLSNYCPPALFTYGNVPFFSVSFQFCLFTLVSFLQENLIL